jgi:hypothetical protein
MEVLASRLSHDSWVPSIGIQICGNIFPQFLKHEGTTGKVESRELAMADRLCNDFGWRTRYELDHPWRNACFLEYLMDEVI